MGEGECEPMVEAQSKKSRHRKKHLYNTILQQMEFYFSDSNLSKDRFLSQLLAESDDIDLDVFLKFNKIKKLNCTTQDIQKAIKKSELIELSEDGLKIHRTKPIKVKDNVDYCTIYVENIKGDANHETLSQIFSDFGKVVYVSIPKYKHNKANKGFAFIEFETEEQAADCIRFFEGIGCRIPPEKNPEELRSIATFEGEQKELNVAPVETKDVMDHEEEKGKKRKLSVDEQDRKKKQKLENGKQETCEVSQVEESEDVKKKKKKKEKRKAYIKELGLQVLLKKDWKKLRNHYLDLQKKKMKEFKQYLYRQKYGPKSQQKVDNEESKEAQELSNSANKLSFTPGIIVKLRLPEPCTDVKKLKNELKSASPEVKYVDVPLPSGSQEIFIRFSNCDAAKDFCTKDIAGEKSLIDGDEEILYWQKIETDRTVKFKKMAKKQRGREKLLKRAERESGKHIRFDEND
ncbi:la-related protein 7 [Anthonomus grandis grandis]|uniref:la-related protein 7 n=1 Tax=Anthonomus grandis grandis TaxID=2921223 RepID=UPI002165307B|nr:la-related protein 7 [Anthonomus grandis grandis]